ncbi:hypothetical protein [Aquimarina litoralis]|uniref:hypothetical protein n=1 Tax=Aquimarina litoralis TaxID=584605 RepID=UPI001C58955C|nr:hypothetical protein [Aquimarina litoralis]MBW1296494.1 hypothetical protein [Aquimarina litoralis]
MKYSLIAAFLIVSLGYSATNPINEKEKNKKEKKEKKEENVLASRNFHSVKRWKINIEYINGEVISKTITLNSNRSLSPLENAFYEAEKYMKTLKNVKSYHVSPVSRNSFVLLAGN